MGTFLGKPSGPPPLKTLKKIKPWSNIVEHSRTQLWGQIMMDYDRLWQIMTDYERLCQIMTDYDRLLHIITDYVR